MNIILLLIALSEDLTFSTTQIQLSIRSILVDYTEVYAVETYFRIYSLAVKTGNFEVLKSL